AGKRGDAARAFEQLTAGDPDDPAAWYDLGLVRAWLGENGTAVEALDRYVALEPDDNRAASAWALAEVLRFGQGMEDQADWVEHSAMFQLREPQQIVNLLQVWQEERRLTAVQVRQEEGLLSGIVLDKAGGLVSVG